MDVNYVQFLKDAHLHVVSSMQPPPGVDAPLMDTAEIVYISSLALLKVISKGDQ